MFKIKKNVKHYDNCFNTLVTNNSDPNNNLGFFTSLREYKENALIFPTIEIYNIMYKCELLFRKNINNLLSNKLKTTDFIETISKDYSANVPSCHNIFNQLVKQFVITRIHFTLKQKSNVVKLTSYSSRSVTKKISVTKTNKI